MRSKATEPSLIPPHERSRRLSGSYLIPPWQKMMLSSSQIPRECGSSDLRKQTQQKAAGTAKGHKSTQLSVQKN